VRNQSNEDGEHLLIEIRCKFASAKWLYTKHAVDRTIERGIWSYEVEEAIGTGEIIEDYPKDKYGPSCLILGWTEEKRPLHIQVTYPRPEEKIKVITLYEPDPKEWKEGFKERRD
jgi:hypothetical protein